MRRTLDGLVGFNELRGFGEFNGIGGFGGFDMQWKVFGDKTDYKLTFEEHVEGLCQKFSAMARISSLMRFEQRKSIFNLFITSHFSYWPLV